MKIRQWYRENDLDSILYLSFKATKAHLILTLPKERSLLTQSISVGSRVPSGYGFISQGYEG